MAEVARPGADRWVPDEGGLDELRAAAPDCRGCELYRDATHVVVSAGSERARLVLVGEQPGDQEDRAGEPFVGPAGRLLADALRAAGVDRRSVYLTNAVKHFRFERRGTRRIHEKPGVAHIEACRPWLERELELVAPRVVVCLGATAVRAVVGRTLPIGANRGRLLEFAGRKIVVTTHPSALLRLRDAGDRDVAFAELVEDLRMAAEVARR